VLVFGVVGGQWHREWRQFEREHVGLDRVDDRPDAVDACGVVVQDPDEDDPADALYGRRVDSRVGGRRLGKRVAGNTDYTAERGDYSCG